jgi:hypothetical protein
MLVKKRFLAFVQRHCLTKLRNHHAIDFEAVNAAVIAAMHSILCNRRANRFSERIHEAQDISKKEVTATVPPMLLLDPRLSNWQP